MIYPRWGGILLHPTSLPGRFGIGDLGDQAYAFIDFLVKSGLNLWQVLPLGPTGYGDSPYQCFSAFAGNPLLISPERLVEEGLLAEEDIRDVPSFPEDRVDFGSVIAYKSTLLRRAFRRFSEGGPAHVKSDFLDFYRSAGDWLEDYALFRALKDEHNGAPWNLWERELVSRDPEAIAAARERLREEIEAEKFYQYLFFKQWDRLRTYCHDRGVQIIGDMPIFVAYDSTEVWTRPDMFKLDGTGNPIVVAGVPPDYFSETGQLWGNPLYDWERMMETGFQWWIDRFRATFELVDIVRVDHFRGFAACWEVPAAERTAINGRWVEVPGHELFATLRLKMGELPIIAEDLGVITPDVEALRDEFGFPGMRILQFAFRADSGNLDLPHNYVNNTIVYTGTHDNDTTVGWFNSRAGAGSTRSAEQIQAERAWCLKYLKSDGKEINWDFIEAAFRSAARMALAPLQDVLGLGSEARMNLPASQEGNWKWRFRSQALTEELSSRLRGLAEFYNRGQSYIRPHPVS
ncbi:MAG TPA: 4-alpha-glucanotransferase [Blastocatellia bacterium]|nr:4-alpha-glucanotransferase [Blastocatellia bacterium]